MPDQQLFQPFQRDFKQKKQGLEEGLDPAVDSMQKNMDSGTYTMNELKAESGFGTSVLTSTFLSTNDFFTWLCKRDWNSSYFLYALKVDFDPNRFLDLVKRSNRFKIVRNDESLLSIVNESDDSNAKHHQKTKFDWHTDGMHLNSPPELALLYCVNPGRGENQTLLADSVKALEKIEYCRSDLSKLNLTYVSKTLQQSTRPLLRVHPRTMETVIPLCDRMYVSQRFEKQTHDDDCPDLRATTQLVRQVYQALDDSIVLIHYWSKNDLLVFDNRRFLQARRGKHPDNDHILYRVWMNTVKEKGMAP